MGFRSLHVSDHLDAGEAQAFALADAHDGRLLTDDGDARSVVPVKARDYSRDRQPRAQGDRRLVAA